jgi:hypothetical protein
MKNASRLLLAATFVCFVAACTGAVPSSPPPPSILVHPPGGTPIPIVPTTGTPEDGPYTAAEFWEYVVPGGDGVEHYESLAAMTEAADAVVVGTIVDLRKDDRYSEADLGGGLVVTMTLKFERTLSGEVNPAAPGELNLSVYVTDPGQYDRFAAGLPAETAIFFLRNQFAEIDTNKGSHRPNDRLYYRVVSDQGLIRDVDGKAIPAVADGEFLTALSGKSFDALVEGVTNASPK